MDSVQVGKTWDEVYWRKDVHKEVLLYDWIIPKDNISTSECWTSGGCVHPSRVLIIELGKVHCPLLSRYVWCEDDFCIATILHAKRERINEIDQFVREIKIMVLIGERGFFFRRLYKGQNVLNILER